MNTLSDWEARWAINGIGEKLFKNTRRKIHRPIFPRDRCDVCVVQMDVLRGVGFFQSVFLVWKNSKKDVCYFQINDINEKIFEDIADDFVNISDVVVNRSGTISIKVSSAGTWSGRGNWSNTIEVPMTWVGMLEC